MKDSYITRETLLIRLRNRHDEDAWHEFVLTYQKYIFAILKNMQLQGASQDDIAQAVLLKAWEKLPEFEFDRTKGKLRSWLAVVTANTAKSHLRQESRLYKVMQSEQSYKLDNFKSADIPAEIEEIARKEWEDFISQKAWENISSTLSESVRQCFEMLMNGQAPSQIASCLNISEGSVYVYKKRVKNKMYCEIVRLQNDLE